MATEAFLLALAHGAHLPYKPTPASYTGRQGTKPFPSLLETLIQQPKELFSFKFPVLSSIYYGTQLINLFALPRLERGLEAGGEGEVVGGPEVRVR